jgi:catechol 2,3-dioxygenase-like lactoylglutathione lyase family enzyme
MESSLDHLQINVRPENMPFYRDLFRFLGWTAVLDEEHFFGMAGSNGGSVWVIGGVKDVANDYDGPGVNHVGVGVPRQESVDEVVRYLEERGIPALFETPRHREIPGKDGHTYYQVMFESPDRVLFEVEYSGPRS